MINTTSALQRTIPAVVEILVASIVQISMQALLIAAMFAFVQRRSGYFPFRRWRASFAMIVAFLMVVDIGFLVVVAYFWATNAPAANAAGATDLSVVGALISGFSLSCVSWPFALISFVGGAFQIQRGGDVLADSLGWLDRYWPNPNGGREQRTVIRDERFL